MTTYTCQMCKSVWHTAYEPTFSDGNTDAAAGGPKTLTSTTSGCKFCGNGLAGVTVS